MEKSYTYIDWPRNHDNRSRPDRERQTHTDEMPNARPETETSLCSVNKVTKTIGLEVAQSTFGYWLILEPLSLLKLFLCSTPIIVISQLCFPVFL